MGRLEQRLLSLSVSRYERGGLTRGNFSDDTWCDIRLMMLVASVWTANGSHRIMEKSL